MRPAVHGDRQRCDGESRRLFPITCKKVLRAQIIALENRIPTIYLVDSSGIFLPLQEDVFPDQDDFGRVYYHNALMSARGIPQIAAIMGNCVAGGAYLPVMCDTLLMTEGSGLSLAGPALVKAAIGQEVTSEELGGARMHAAVSGTIDFREPDDPACLHRIRALAGAIGDRPRGVFDRQPPAPPAFDGSEIHGIFTNTPRARRRAGRHRQGCRPERVRGVQSRIRPDARLRDGPHQRLRRRHRGQPAHPDPRADGPMEFGGVIYAESADKAARFMMQCNQHLIPLVFLHDVSGFMVGKEAEASGIIRAGAKMVNVVSNSVVPKITVIMGGSFGAGNYALCGKAFGPRFIFAWPTAQYRGHGRRPGGQDACRHQAETARARGENAFGARSGSAHGLGQAHLRQRRWMRSMRPPGCGWTISSTPPRNEAPLGPLSRSPTSTPTYRRSMSAFSRSKQERMDQESKIVPTGHRVAETQSILVFSVTLCLCGSV